MGYYIVVGCVLIYAGAYLLRLLMKGYVLLTGTTLRAHNVRYSTIGAATLLLILLMVIRGSRLEAPDYSYLWTYLVSGVIVFAISVGRSYWWWKRAQRLGFQRSGELIGIDPWGHERHRPPARESSEEDEESAFGEIIVGIAVALIGASVSVTTTYDVDPDALIGLVLAPALWLGEGFVTAITNPYYLGGLVIGVGTGWIARGAFPE